MMTHIFSLVAYQDEGIAHCVGWGDWDSAAEAKGFILASAKEKYPTHEGFWKWSIALAKLTAEVLSADEGETHEANHND